MSQPTESTIETTLQPAPNAIKEQFRPPGIDPSWQVAKAAQLRYIQLQRRSHVLVPMMIALAVGIGIGFAALPLVLKVVLAVAALVLAVQSTLAVYAQKRETDAIYDDVRPDTIKVKGKQE
jgi:hypothetical protein